jgi:hypothetical protein
MKEETTTNFKLLVRYIRSEVLAEVVMKSYTFWDIATLKITDFSEEYTTSTFRVGE